jgi:hemophore-related protein
LSSTGRIDSPAWTPEQGSRGHRFLSPDAVRIWKVQFVMTFSKKLAVGMGALALSLTAGAGVAFADPLDQIVNSTCTYPQVVSALNAENPDAAAQFNSSPVAQGYLSRFIAAPPAQRRQMAAQVQGIPQAQQYFGLIEQVAGSCNNY